MKQGELAGALKELGFTSEQVGWTNLSIPSQLLIACPRYLSSRSATW